MDYLVWLYVALFHIDGGPITVTNWSLLIFMIRVKMFRCIRVWTHCGRIFVVNLHFSRIWSGSDSCKDNTAHTVGKCVVVSLRKNYFDYGRIYIKMEERKLCKLFIGYSHSECLKIVKYFVITVIS